MSPRRMRPINNLRWWIAGLLALATALNYLDRQSFPVVVGEIRKEIPMSNEQYGRLGSAFLLAYAIMYAGGGRIMDWLGARLGYTVMIVWWSVANALTGTASSVLSLAMFAHQFWSASLQTLPADLFPARAVGSVEGLLGSAGSFGGMLFGLVVGALVEHQGYGPAFAAAGVLHSLAFLVILFSVRRVGPLFP